MEEPLQSQSHDQNLRDSFRNLALNTGHVLPHLTETSDLQTKKYLEIIASAFNFFDKDLHSTLAEHGRTVDSQFTKLQQRFTNLHEEVSTITGAVHSLDKSSDNVVQQLADYERRFKKTLEIHERREKSRENRRQNGFAYRPKMPIFLVEPDSFPPIPPILQNLTLQAFWSLRHKPNVHSPDKDKILHSLCLYYGIQIQKYGVDRAHDFESDNDDEDDDDDEDDEDDDLTDNDEEDDLTSIGLNPFHFHMAIAHQMGLNYSKVERYIDLLRVEEGERRLKRKRKRLAQNEVQVLIQVPKSSSSVVPESPYVEEPTQRDDDFMDHNS